MSAVRNICQITEILPKNLSPPERIVLQAFIFDMTCIVLKEMLLEKFGPWFSVLRMTKREERRMIEREYVKFIVEDILATGAYNLDGLARYIRHDAEILEDILAYRNPRPSIVLLNSIMDIHQSVRPEFYRAIKKKILSIIHGDDEDEGGGSEKK